MKLYPDIIPEHPSHPKDEDFQVVEGDFGKVLVTHRSWHRGQSMARFDGVTSPKVLQHTLQKTPLVHIHDPYFIGMLAHSCDPNVMLDMDQQEMIALKDIGVGAILSMDYASTEDYLYATFKCGCRSPNCRGHVTGRRQRAPQTPEPFKQFFRPMF